MKLLVRYKIVTTFYPRVTASEVVVALAPLRIGKPMVGEAKASAPI